MASYYQQYSPTYKNEKHGYGSWYQNCNCCPYGYHIDLDFVQFCDSIVQPIDRTGSMKKRRDRRRQRQSMEVLLGLEPYPLLVNLEQAHQKAIHEESTELLQKQNVNQFLLQDDLDEAVWDFERTLKRSKKLSSNLPDVTAVHENIRRVPSTSSVSSISGFSMTVLPPSVTDGNATKDFDTMSVESYGLSPIALQNIREQMALSLERTKELEERVKLIPSLQTQLSTLKKEKQQLLLKIKEQESLNLNKINGNYLNNSDEPVRLKSEPKGNVKESSPVASRDFGVSCTVLTRHVGVGHQYPNTRSISTATINDYQSHSDKWYNEKVKFLENGSHNLAVERSKNCISKTTQTILPNRTVHSFTQTLENVKKLFKDSTSQTPSLEKPIRHIGINVKNTTSECASQTSVPTKTVGVSDDSTNDILCTKCISDSQKLSLDAQSGSSISLASLVARSKSFNLGDDKLNLSLKNRTIGCQYEPFTSTKSSQSESKTHQSKSCQKEVKVIHKAVQYESNTFTKITDTKDLDVEKKSVACNTKVVKTETVEAECNTNFGIEKSCPKCSIREKEDLKKDDSFTPSRIPRPQIPTTPVESRKFKRQDTYTKIPAATNETYGLSGLDLSGKHENPLPSSFEKVKQNYKLNVSPQNEAAQETQLPMPSDDFNSSVAPSQHRKKVKPSKEMQAAMKVLNDSLQKGQTRNLKNQLKNAINIILQEWFQISSLDTANPLDVEDYLDNFEEISCNLLQYIVNMVDASGNTAMHYAVSHGNFDVVSILLDSKVCDINQTNKVGYTSVMLVSLALCSTTHANVVRRLFQLADVNIRAKHHGQTALMLAVSHGRLDMVQMLIEAGADINIQDEDGSTALMCAAEHGHIDIVKYLLSLPDCDSTIVDVDGSTALKIAMEAGHRHIGVLLYAHERNLHGASGPKLKRTKSASGSPKTPSSPLPLRSSHRALSDTRSNK